MTTLKLADGRPANLKILESFNEFFELFLPSMMISLVVFAILVMLYLTLFRRIDRQHIPFLMAFCFIGAIPGIIAGYSQQAIAGTFLTATVGIVTALLSYLFAKDSLADWRPVVPFAIIATVTCALAGFSAGGISKKKWIEYDELNKDRRVELEQVWIPVERERQLLNLRKQSSRVAGMISQAEVVKIQNEGTPPPAN